MAILRQYNWPGSHFHLDPFAELGAAKKSPGHSAVPGWHKGNTDLYFSCLEQPSALWGSGNSAKQRKMLYLCVQY